MFSSDASLFKNLNLNASQSDPLVNMYFDFYLKCLASFSYEIKYRRHFLFVNSKTIPKRSLSSEEGASWQLIDLEGDVESVESVLVDISEDDLVRYENFVHIWLFSFEINKMTFF